MTTRKKEPVILTRRERAARQAQQARRQRRQMLTYLAIAAGLAVVVIAAAVLLNGGAQPALGQAVPDAGNSHVAEGTPIQYDRVPPSSGTHYPQTARYGLHENPVPEGYWVHNLEHGAIAVLYNCPDGCPDLVDQLRQAYESFPTSARFNTVKMVIVPYPQLSTKLAYLAWGWEYLTDTFDRDELFRFYQAHLDRGPEMAP